MARSSFALALALLSIGPTPVAAQPEPTADAVRFVYRAPAECPDAAAFVARIRERTPRGRLADPGELARTFNVTLAADAQGFVGEIQFLDDGGAEVSRRLHGEQCDAVVTSLALITALALDATLRPEETPVAPAPPPHVEPPPLAPPPPVETPRPSRLPAPRSLSDARVGGTVGYDSAIGAARFGLLGQLGWRGGFALRLSPHYASAEPTDSEGRRAELRVLGIETSVCPWRFRLDQLALAPCATLDLGSLRGRGVKSEKLTAPGSDTIVWAAVGAELRLVWDVAAPVWVELDGGGAFPLAATHKFRFEAPRQDVYTVPHFSGSVGGALGVRFW